MNNSNITQQLLQGSANLDRMEKEIDQVVKMILGYVLKKHGSRNFSLPGLESTTVRWDVSIRTYPDSSRIEQVYVSCTPKENTFCKYDIRSEFNGLTVENVQVVWENLHLFVNGMINAFPTLAEELTPFMKAAHLFSK